MAVPSPAAMAAALAWDGTWLQPRGVRLAADRRMANVIAPGIGRAQGGFARIVEPG